MNPPLWYVAHPVGQEPQRAENLRRVMRWFEYLIGKFPDDAFVIPWLPYCNVLTETPENRARGIRDDLLALKRCDGIALVGGALSNGMRHELDVALSRHLRVMDLLHLGEEPPQ